MEPIREMAGLMAYRGRAAGSDAERRAAHHLCSRLRRLGREAAIQVIRVRPRFGLTHALHALLAVVGSVVAAGEPALGTAIVLATAVSALLDATGALQIVRRLTGWRVSQNIESRERSDKPGTLILVAHYDSARDAPGFALARRALGNPLRAMLAAMALVLACCTLRLGGLEGVGLTVVQFLPTLLLIVLIPAFADLELSEVAAGGADNAAGVVTVLRLADELGGTLEHFDLWVLLTGAQKPFALGMRSWLGQRGRELHPRRTAVLNVDGVGGGGVSFSTHEGPVFARRSQRQLVRICEGIAEDDRGDGARPRTLREATDAAAAVAAGLPAITISCEGEMVDPAGLDRAFDFCRELVERLDAQVGPRLAAEDGQRPGAAAKVGERSAAEQAATSPVGSGA